MKMKTPLRYHLISVSMTNIKNNNDDLSWKGCGERKTLFHFWREYKLVIAILEIIMAGSWENGNQSTTGPGNPTLRHIPK